jgi:hypothetical protein
MAVFVKIITTRVFVDFLKIDIDQLLTDQDSGPAGAGIHPWSR